MRDKDKQIVEHLLKHCKEIRMTAERFGNSKEVFKSDFVFYNACAMSLFQIGELSKRFSDEFKQSHAEFPWKEMRGLRNVFAHEYDAVDKDRFWETIQNDIPKLVENIEKITKETL
ncbi:MAG: DUF86 domain-containing protein [Selenomonadaceae bacterium]|nr:DUF86 domain-containing protein [Selenomonadaceae bacterium]